MNLKHGWLRDEVEMAAKRVASGFATPRESRLEGALKDIAELGAENGAAWCQTRARRVLTEK